MGKSLKIIAYLARLPRGYRELALTNYHKLTNLPNVTLVDNSASAVNTAFVWGATPEGHDFWFEVYTALNMSRPSKLPPLP